MNRSGIILISTVIAAVGIFATVIGTSTTLKDAIALAQTNNFASAGHVVRLWASQWDSSSQLKIADMYWDGKGIRHDRREANAWYKIAAESGNAEAQNKLGFSYENGQGESLNYAKALKWYQRSADQGYVKAMLNVAWIHTRGLGVPKSDSEALTWFRNAAEHGDAVGQLMVGTAFVSGDGVQADKAEAVYWLRKSAAQGNASAEYMLSSLYTSGEGVPQDLVQAKKWMAKAAAQGYPDAQFSIGAMYFNGTGISWDVEKANDYFLKAATQGNADAQEALGQIYNAGEYGTQYKVTAYAFFNLAAAQGNEKAAKEKTVLADVLTPEQITAGQAIASNWKPMDPLPFKISFEDIAPQILLRDNATSEVYKATRVWFTQDFSVSGTRYHTIFLVTKGEECHACKANIGAVTFPYKNGVSQKLYGMMFDVRSQPNFLVMGTYGDVEGAHTDTERTDAIMYPLGKGKVAVLVNDDYEGQGERDNGKEILVFDGQNGWRDVGGIATSGSRLDDCRKATVGELESAADMSTCYSWSGTVELESGKNKDWPDFVVKGSGTDVDYSSNKPSLVNVSSVTYQYDGHKYVANLGKK